MEKMKKQPDMIASSTDEENIEETATSTHEVTSHENSTTTESVPEYVEVDNATSTATSTPSESEPYNALPVGVLPLTMVSVFGYDLKRVKKKITLLSALFLAFGVSLYLILFVPYWLSFIDLNTLVNNAKAIPFDIDDDLFWMIVITLPAILTSLSLLHYKSRETVYKAWLAYSVLGFVAFIVLLIGIDDNFDFIDRAFVYGLGGIYVAGSLLIWLYGVITHFFRKK